MDIWNLKQLYDSKIIRVFVCQIKSRYEWNGYVKEFIGSNDNNYFDSACLFIV